MDGPVFRWGSDYFEVSASRNGVVIAGHSPQMKHQQTNNFISVIQLASSVHCQLLANNYPDQLYFVNESINRNVWINENK